MRYLLFVVVLFCFGNLFAQDNESSNQEPLSEKCNCNANQFQQKFLGRYPDEKFLSEYLLDFKPDSGADNKEFVYNTIKEHLKAALARKIRSNVTTTETYTLSEKTKDNSSRSSESNYSTTAVSETNVDLSNTGFRICPDKRNSNTYHGVIFIERDLFIKSQLAYYRVMISELETEVTLYSENLNNYSIEELAKKYRKFSLKNAQIGQVAVIYSSLTKNDELSGNVEIAKSRDNILSGLQKIKNKTNNKDIQLLVDSVKLYLNLKAYPQAYLVTEQILRVNPYNEQVKGMQNQCLKWWVDDGNKIIDDFLRDNRYEDALYMIDRSLFYKIEIYNLKDRFKNVVKLFFDDVADKIQKALDSKDTNSAKTLLSKLQPYSKHYQERYDDLAHSIEKAGWE